MNRKAYRATRVKDVKMASRTLSFASSASAAPSASIPSGDAKARAAAQRSSTEPRVSALAAAPSVGFGCGADSLRMSGISGRQHEKAAGDLRQS